MFGGFFAGRRVLVTGAAGVKGSWLALKLLAAGATVIGVDKVLPEPESNFVGAGLARRVEFLQLDVADLQRMQEVVDRVDCIFHLAAVALVGEARSEPWEAYRSNTWGTVGVLEAIRRSSSAKYAVFITTDKVYRPNDGEPWRETDPLGASGPYAVSKACADQIISDYYRMYLRPASQRIGVGRGGNVLIGGDLYSSRRYPGAGRIFVDCYDALIEGRPPEILQPTYTRPYTYGLDIIGGYLTLMSCLDADGVSGEAFNFGPRDRLGISNGVLATKICEAWGGPGWIRGPARDEPFASQSLNWEKSRRLLGWTPAFTLDEAVQETTRWYREWARWRKQPHEGGLAGLAASLIDVHQQAVTRLAIQRPMDFVVAAGAGSG